MNKKTIGAALCFFLLLGSAAAFFHEESFTSSDSKAEPARYTLILQQEMPDGEMVTEKKIETVWSVEDFWMKYRDWNVVDQNQEEIILRRPGHRK
ncbi:BofC N-terminal domain-containing protein [Salibacterium qingdaonense]|uniref:Bypass of Forespore C, N terminal n=1 Tax=Salibacterium qingdaonense TaxID=266892 RepID=A0A1I4JCH2_9BACI|nr:BofC N-terminal domain-containing protein [Salibacterium qingdaonense]SFL64254.1 Bypass of Forespore C, N terminal [Salibacterium qingdaonense]